MDDYSDKFAPLTDAEISAGTNECTQAQRAREARTMCPPDDAEHGRDAAARIFGRPPDHLWRYAMPEGETAFYALRWDMAEGKKTFRPLSYIEGEGWAFVAWADHRPLYRLDDISARPDAAIVICEGEKAADAAARIFPQSIVTTSSGGALAAAKSDWTPLAGRRVLLWPDQDDAGRKYAREIAAILAALNCAVSIIDAAELAAVDPGGGAREPQAKWDAADAVADWPDLGALRRAAVGLAKPHVPGPAFLSYGPYEMTAEGLRVEVETGRGKTKAKECILLCSAFEVIGRCRDPHGAAGANICAGAILTGERMSAMLRRRLCRAIRRRFARCLSTKACRSIGASKGNWPTICPARTSKGA